MQTPEEHLRDLLVGYCEVWGKPGHEWCIHGRAPEGICPKGHGALELIRARDAEVLRDAADAIDGGADEGDLDPLDFTHHTDYGEALAARKVRDRADQIERGDQT